jgi:hypothetical protein
MTMTSITAQTILNLGSCADQTSRELMAHRWVWMPEQGDRPSALHAPRFSRVPCLRIDHPSPGRRVRVTLDLWSDAEWFSHARVRHSADDKVVTLANTLSRGCRWRSFALEMPGDARWLEIGKTEEMSCWLIGIDWEECTSSSQARAFGGNVQLMGATGILDGTTFLGSTILPAYEPTITRDFYRQMRDAGFTQVFLQVYAGSAGWSNVARRHKPLQFGHVSYANHREAGYAVFDTVDGLRRQLDFIREAGLSAGASFRINNEWLAPWALKWYQVQDGIPEVASTASVEHRNWWMTYKDGNRYGSGLDFGFPEVGDYRLAVVKEWCDLFQNFDTLCIDLCRHPPMVSYPEHLVQAFKERTGIDVRLIEPVDQDTLLEEWLRFRASFFTQWMRRVRAVLDQARAGATKLSARVGNSMSRALQDGAELDVWFREKLVDEIMFESGTERHLLEEDVTGLLRLAREGGVTTVCVFGKAGSMSAQAGGRELMLRKIHDWKQQGADSVGFYEAERLAAMGEWIESLPASLRRD